MFVCLDFILAASIIRRILFINSFRTGKRMENARDLPAPPNLAQAHKFSTKEDVALNLNVISIEEKKKSAKIFNTK